MIMNSEILWPDYSFLSLGDHIHDDTVEDAEDQGEQGAVKSPDNEVKPSEEEAEYLPRR